MDEMLDTDSTFPRFDINDFSSDLNDPGKLEEALLEDVKEKLFEENQETQLSTDQTGRMNPLEVLSQRVSKIEHSFMMEETDLMFHSDDDILLPLLEETSGTGFELYTNTLMNFSPLYDSIENEEERKILSKCIADGITQTSQQVRYIQPHDSNSKMVKELSTSDAADVTNLYLSKGFIPLLEPGPGEERISHIDENENRDINCTPAITIPPAFRNNGEAWEAEIFTNYNIGYESKKMEKPVKQQVKKIKNENNTAENNADTEEQNDIDKTSLSTIQADIEAIMESIKVRSKQEKKKRIPLKSEKFKTNIKSYVDKYTDSDILLGRGTRSNRHPGNIAYLQRIYNVRSKYRRPMRRKEKSDFIRSFVRSIETEQGGRFLKYDDVAKKWYRATAQEAYNKVSQGLREHQTKEEREENKLAKKQKASILAP